MKVIPTIYYDPEMTYLSPVKVVPFEHTFEALFGKFDTDGYFDVWAKRWNAATDMFEFRRFTDVRIQKGWKDHKKDAMLIVDERLKGWNIVFVQNVPRIEHVLGMFITPPAEEKPTEYTDAKPQ